VRRRSLPSRRHHITQKVKIAGQRTLYLSVHDDPHPAEIFLRVKGLDCSSELIGLYDVIARLMSLALQYGAPACEGRRSPRRRPVCPVWPGVWTRSPQALFEFAGSDWPASAGRVLRASRAGTCAGRRARGRLTMDRRPELMGKEGKRAGRGASPRRERDLVPRSSHITQKGVVPVRDRLHREGVMKFFLSTKTERAPVRVRP
jgi:hypothetical protein